MGWRSLLRLSKSTQKPPLSSTNKAFTTPSMWDGFCHGNELVNSDTLDVLHSSQLGRVQRIVMSLMTQPVIQQTHNWHCNNGHRIPASCQLLAEEIQYSTQKTGITSPVQYSTLIDAKLLIQYNTSLLLQRIIENKRS